MEQFGQPKIGHARLSLSIQQDIGWLKVSVQHTVFMGKMNGLSHRLENARGLPRRAWPLAQDLREVLAGHKLHAVKMPARLLSRLINSHDIRVLQPAGGSRFSPKTRNV